MNITHIRRNTVVRRAEELGAGLVEYALLVALIAVVCIAAVTFVGTSNSSKLDKAGNAVTGATEPPLPCYEFMQGGVGEWHHFYGSGQTMDGRCP